MKLAKWRMGTIATIIPNSHVTYRCGANGHNGTIHDQGERKYIYDIQVHAEKHVAKCESCRQHLAATVGIAKGMK